jgi:uncharacterized membrane protein
VSAADPEAPAPDSLPDEESESRASERLVFFSDAVVAIAMTLLALDLPVPEGNTVSNFLHSVSSNSTQYLAFLVSFWTISGAWSNHHDVFRYLKRADGRLRTLDMAWLMLIVLIPFATRLLTSKGDTSVSGNLTINAFQWGFYALVQTLDSALMLAMLRHMADASLAPDLPARTLRSVSRLELTLMAAFGLSIPVFFATPYAWGLWIAVPFGRSWWVRLRRRRADEDTSRSQPSRPGGHQPTDGV